MFVCFSLAIYPHQGATADDSTVLTNLLNDARIHNLSHFNQGRMLYSITHGTRGKRPVHIKATVTWTGNTAMWVYAISDPDKLVTGNSAYGKAIEDCPTEYMLMTNNQLFLYNGITNRLHIYRHNYPTDVVSHFYLFDVFPKTMWSTCCPPFQAIGRNWSDMIGKNYESLTPGSKVEMIRQGPDEIRQIKTESNGSITELTFSLKFSGNITNLKRLSKSRPDDSESASFEWQKLTRDVTALQGLTIVRGEPGQDGTKAKETFELKVEECSLSKPTEITFDVLKSLLPRDTIVQNHIQNKSYLLFPESRPQPSEAYFTKAIEELKTKGFFGPK